jgi:(1->4)-alpha-D-glucan 1-alpha-D-glucosylmutase
VRARIAALTLPGLREGFAALARAWVPTAPDANEGWMILQTLLGAWPIEPLQRLDGFIEKALREAKVNTSWVDQDTRYEASVQRWARNVLTDPDFRSAFDPLVERVAGAGATAALGQVALKLTAPGIPDIYGGDEVAYRSLVDPDNRRSIDFGALTSARDDPKRALVRAALALRGRRPEAFAGAYEPVEAGPDVIAFRRGGDVHVEVALTPDARPSKPTGWDEVFAMGGVVICER